ncbi:DUF3102 domain-containing protein [Desulfosporosinus fructosivorans]|uniref:DUF3102 domain-containing protein n=1 Tax=Desulfosporosinus fructosivorans TaxID=2018669 RepID=A0A4Z0QZG4_9FIRM|nr:DUF3102 domain-containing protein [Desulfosporosinus fructosivorans]TGE36182.1 DUF3102 domain-containing protein [Desulfosporosinus fructosivorans]
MNFYCEYGPILSAPDDEESPNVAPVHHLNYTQGLILFGIPVEERDQFTESRPLKMKAIPYLWRIAIEIPFQL